MALDISSIRPNLPQVPTAAPRISAETVQQSVPTQLPEPQAVTATASASAPRNDPSNERNLSRQVIYDQGSAEFIYQVVDEANESVVHQYPDEARVRARTYFRELDQAQADRRRLHTDRTA